VKTDVLVLITDSTYAYLKGKTPSESVARDKLKEVITGHDFSGKALIISTFSSHIARLKTLVDLGKKTGRKVLMLGRSLYKYVTAAEDVGIVKFSDSVEMVKYGSKIRKRLRKLMKDGKEEYFIIATGHQGEPKATLSKMVDQKIGFVLDSGDTVIFSCKVIPTPTNKENRAYLEKQLKNLGVDIFKDVHVSGHASRDDLREMVRILKPKNIVPAHGDLEKRAAFASLALEMGYTKRNVLLLSDGGVAPISEDKR